MPSLHAGAELPGPLVERTNRRTGARFLSCSTYPRCKGARKLTWPQTQVVIPEAPFDAACGVAQGKPRRYPEPSSTWACRTTRPGSPAPAFNAPKTKTPASCGAGA